MGQPAVKASINPEPWSVTATISALVISNVNWPSARYSYQSPAKAKSTMIGPIWQAGHSEYQRLSSFSIFYTGKNVK